jgi:hypothetical protein
VQDNFIFNRKLERCKSKVRYQCDTCLMLYLRTQQFKFKIHGQYEWALRFNDRERKGSDLLQIINDSSCISFFLSHLLTFLLSDTIIKIKKKVKISLLQAVEAPRVARGRGSHIT